MKKLLCLLMSFALVFCFAACGGETEDGGKSNVKITFDAESYTVEVDDYITLSEHITVEPAGTVVKYSGSDETIAELTAAAKGEFMGVKSGEVTVTVKTEDGKVTATCKLVVAGMGTVVARDGNVGGITNKRWDAVERPDDFNARILVISKNIAKDADMTGAVTLNYGEKASDDSAAKAYNGYWVAKTGETGNYELEKVPEGDYIGLIVSSVDYSVNKTYDKATAAAKLTGSALASVMSEADMNKLVELIYNYEFHVGEFSVKTNETTVFGYAFQPDLDMAEGK